MEPTGKYQKPDGFVEIPFTCQHLDRYVIRKAILEGLHEVMPMFEGRLLDVGCGAQPYRRMIVDQAGISSYTGLDLEGGRSYPGEGRPDVFWNGIRMPFKEDSFQTVMATEVMEHLDHPDMFLKEVWRVLENGGLFFFTVPFLWNLHEVPNDAYRYTPFRLKKHLLDNGYRDIEIRAGGGWHAAMAMMLGLWVRRSPLTTRYRNILSRGVKLMMTYLLKKDIKPVAPFREGQMITNLYGWARK